MPSKRSLHRQVSLYAVGWAAAGLMGCHSAQPLPLAQVVLFSPPVIQTEERPWDRAEKIVAAVPGTRFFVGHGDSMRPLYPSGTIMVLQRLTWERLAVGMTVVYGVDPENPFHLVCHVLAEKADARSWVVQGLNNPEPDLTRVTRDNYVGTVIAALRRREAEPAPPTLPAMLVRSQDAYCIIRCHVGGETFPRDLPPALRGVSQPQAGPAGRESRAITALLRPAKL
jgi:hypothetical protein